MMLVEADAVIAEPVKLLPGFEMLGIGAYRDGRLEISLAQRIRQRRSIDEIVERLGIGQQVKYEDFHGISFLRSSHPTPP